MSNKTDTIKSILADKQIFTVELKEEKVIELRLTKKETVLLITALKSASFWNEVDIDLVDNILAENLITELNKKLIEEILEEPEEKEKEDNLPF